MFFLEIQIPEHFSIHRWYLPKSRNIYIYDICIYIYIYIYIYILLIYNCTGFPHDIVQCIFLQHGIKKKFPLPHLLFQNQDDLRNYFSLFLTVCEIQPKIRGLGGLRANLLMVKNPSPEHTHLDTGQPYVKHQILSKIKVAIPISTRKH